MPPLAHMPVGGGVPPGSAFYEGSVTLAVPALMVSRPCAPCTWVFPLTIPALRAGSTHVLPARRPRATTNHTHTLEPYVDMFHVFVEPDGVRVLPRVGKIVPHPVKLKIRHDQVSIKLPSKSTVT